THGGLKILRAYALSPGGERQEAASIRNGEIRFRNLRVGSQTVVQYIHYASAPSFLPGAYVASWMFQAFGREHESSTWVLVLPHGRALQVHRSPSVDEQVSTVGDRDVHVFHAEHQRPLTQEHGMTPGADLLARVDVSTVDGWDDYVRWERALLVDAFRTNPHL